MNFDTPLPIDTVLPEVSAALAADGAAVVVAPPGAGKTTRIPLVLLDAPWRGDGRIIVLEPRRLAARGAAMRMAQTVGEPLGGLIGMRARLASKVGSRTRIEVVTEGVFTRMILDDPSLEGVVAVLFDEFHERSLDADTGLAFALDCRRGLREDLRVLVMSATLDGARVADILGCEGKPAPLIVSEGRAFPIETRYLGRDASARIEAQMADAVCRALAAEQGSILAFLPGQGEIRRTQERLAERLQGRDDVLIAPLHGGLTPAEQDVAVRPLEDGRRKVVLATAIAETSLTIDGVRVVIDCGLSRVPRFEPGAGITRLETVRASQASVEQRRGRAGRTQPGVCYRLWDEPQTRSLPAYTEPEIRSADLTGLMLDCAEWGVRDVTDLSWLDPPSATACDVAREELRSLDAVDGDGRITDVGRRLRALPLPPRLARMISVAAEHGAARDAADIAAVLVERGLGGHDPDLAVRLANARRDRGRRAEDMRRMARRWADTATAQCSNRQLGEAGEKDWSVARYLALAFPDRIAKARGAPGQFLMASGRGAHLDASDPLAREPYLVIGSLQGRAQSTRILLAAGASEDDVLSFAGERVTVEDELMIDADNDAVLSRRMRRLGAIVLSREPVAVADEAAAAELLARHVASRGIDRLPWSKAQRQLRGRVGFLRSTADVDLPDLSDDALAGSAQAWLAPFLPGVMRLRDITPEHLAAALDSLVPWDLRQRLDREVPVKFTAPTGNSFAIDYGGEHAPAVHVRVQELFGLNLHPTIANGRVPMTLYLLSPAQRPIQITRDLPGFWAGSWSGVKADMKGRYPKHVWPDDPANAQPTARAKPRGSGR